jgi:hypothetical protein
MQTLGWWQSVAWIFTLLWMLQWKKETDCEQLFWVIEIKEKVQQQLQCGNRLRNRALVLTNSFSTLQRTDRIYISREQSVNIIAKGWSKRFCAPDGYSTKTRKKHFKPFQSLTMITYLGFGITDGVLYWTRSSRTQFSVSINVWRLAGDTLNINWNFLYCNHQVHTNILITLYKNALGIYSPNDTQQSVRQNKSVPGCNWITDVQRASAEIFTINSYIFQCVAATYHVALLMVFLWVGNTERVWYGVRRSVVTPHHHGATRRYCGRRHYGHRKSCHDWFCVLTWFWYGTCNKQRQL